jgi:signal transduction histidine kinase
MKGSLAWRVAAGMALVFAALGVVLSIWTAESGRRTEDAVIQRANRALAGELLRRYLGDHATGADLESIKQAFASFMDINPAIELYLLGRDGTILTWAPGPSRPVTIERVDLDPLARFVRGDANLPIHGDDPRRARRQTVFSAAPLARDGQVEGYLYVVLLGGQHGDGARDAAAWLDARSAGGVALAVTIAGLAAFGLLAMPLARMRGLTEAVESFRDGGFTRMPAPGDTRRDDEIGRLAAAFGAMSQRMVEQIEALRQADAARRELIANVSHDLRTPLASLRGYVDTMLMRGDALPAHELRNYLDVLARQSAHLSRLVNELFDLAKLEADDAEISAEPMHMGELVQDVAQKFEVAAREAGIELQAEIAPELPRVNADIGMMERVLDNLIGNALRHTPRGGKVLIRIARADHGLSDHGLRVEVVDTGPGIAAEDLPHIFERHYRAEKSRGSAHGGAGLGLAIARRVLDLHGAIIQVDSVPGRGARFHFTLAAAGAEACPTR